MISTLLRRQTIFTWKKCARLFASPFKCSVDSSTCFCFKKLANLTHNCASVLKVRWILPTSQEEGTLLVRLTLIATTPSPFVHITVGLAVSLLQRMKAQQIETSYFYCRPAVQTGCYHPFNTSNVFVLADVVPNLVWRLESSEYEPSSNT